MRHILIVLGLLLSASIAWGQTYQLQHRGGEIDTLLNSIEGMVFNVKAYGAVGNGVADDGAAIAAAAAAAKVVRGKVYFPNGSYVYRTPIVIDTIGMALEGQTMGGVWLLFHGDGTLPAIQVWNNGGATTITNVSIRNISINCDSALSAIEMRNVQRSTFENIRIGPTIHTAATAANYFTNGILVKGGLTLDFNNIDVSAKYDDATTGAVGIKLDTLSTVGGYTTTTSIRNSHINYTRTAGVYLGYGTSSCVFQNVVSEGNAGDAFYVIAGGSPRNNMFLECYAENGNSGYDNNDLVLNGYGTNVIGGQWENVFVTGGYWQSLQGFWCDSIYNYGDYTSFTNIKYDQGLSRVVGINDQWGAGQYVNVRKGNTDATRKNIFRGKVGLTVLDEQPDSALTVTSGGIHTTGGLKVDGAINGNVPQVFNVKQYGATGNGTTDDRAAIQAAINAARGSGGVNTPGGTIFFPAGTYRIKSAVDLTYARGLHLRGAGSWATNIVFETNKTIGFDFTGSGDCSVKEMRLTCDAFTTEADSAKAPSAFIVFARDSISEAGGRQVISGWNVVQDVIIHGPQYGTKATKALLYNYGSETDKYDAVRLTAYTDSVNALHITSVDDLKLHSTFVTSWKAFSSMSDITVTGGTIGAANSTAGNHDKSALANRAVFIHNAQNVVFTGTWITANGNEHVKILADTAANACVGISFVQTRFESYLSENATNIIDATMNGGNISFGVISGFGDADSAFLNCTGGSDMLLLGNMVGITTTSPHMVKSTAAVTSSGFVDAKGKKVTLGTNQAISAVNVGTDKVSSFGSSAYGGSLLTDSSHNVRGGGHFTGGLKVDGAINGATTVSVGGDTTYYDANFGIGWGGALITKNQQGAVKRIELRLSSGSDLAPALRRALAYTTAAQIAPKVYIPPGGYVIGYDTATVTIPDFADIEFAPGAYVAVKGGLADTIFLFNGTANARFVGGTFYEEASGLANDWIAFCLYSPSGAQPVGYNTFRDIRIHDPKVAFDLYADSTTGTDGWVNSNVFENVTVKYMETVLKTRRHNNSAVSGNSFINLNAQSSTPTKFGIDSLVGWGNSFVNCQFFDFPEVAGARTAVISSGATNTAIWGGSVIEHGFVDNGAGTMYVASDSNLIPVSKIGNVPQVYNVKSYGAHADTTVSDSAAFMSAINAASANGGGRVYVPKGQYWVGTLDLPSNIELFGEGDSSIIMSKDNCANGVLQITGTDSLMVNNPRNIYVHDLQLRSSWGSFVEQYHLFRILGATSLRIERVKFQQWRGDAIYLGATGSGATRSHNADITIRNCVFEGVTYEQRNVISVIDGTDILIENNRIRRTGKSTMPGGIDVEPNTDYDRTRNITIRGNRFFDVRGNVAPISLVLRNQDASYFPRRNFLIEGNTIDSCYHASGTSYGILVQGGTTMKDSTVSHSVVVRNNTINRVSRTLGIFGIGHVLFDGNTFTDTDLYGYVGYSGAADSVKYIRFTNNTFYRTSLTHGSTLIIGHVRYLTFEGNTFIDCGKNDGTTGTLIGFMASMVYSHVSVVRNTVVNPTGRTKNAITSTTPVTVATTNILSGNDFAGLSYSAFPRTMEIKADIIRGGIPQEWSLPIDSTAMALYGTAFDRDFFKTGADSLAIDSLVARSRDRATGDTVSVRILWGTANSPTDSLADLKCYHDAGGVAAVQTKVIPPNNYVWMKLTEKDGAPKQLLVILRGWKKTP